MHALMIRTPRPARLRLALEPPTQAVAAGTRARFALRVENRGAPQDIRVAVDATSTGWIASLPVDRLVIPTGGAVTLFVRVDVPADALPGVRESFRVGACAGGGRWRWHEVEAVVASADDSE